MVSNLLAIPMRMSKDTQKDLGMTDSEAEFDKFLQMDPGPERDRLQKKLKAKSISNDAYQGLLRSK